MDDNLSPEERRKRLERCRELRDIFEGNIQHLALQVANHGGEARSPVDVINQLHDNQNELNKIQAEIKLLEHRAPSQTVQPIPAQKLTTSSSPRRDFVYKNFDVQISQSPTKQRYVAKVNSPEFGDATHDFELLFEPFELKYLFMFFGRIQRTTRRIEPSHVQVTKEFGTKLFDAVFAGTVRDCLLSSLYSTTEKGQHLRIRLNLTAVPELANLPWEYLYSSSTRHGFLATSVHTPIVRYLDKVGANSPINVDFPLNMLVMISNPKSPEGREKLDVEGEWQRLEESVSELTQRGLLTLKRLPKATPEALLHELRNRNYHIFHFIGHGGYNKQTQEGILMLENEQGGENKVGGLSIEMLLRDYLSSLRLVVINACEGARSGDDDSYTGIAQTLVRAGISSVVAMQFEITDEAAIDFARNFYAAIADGLAVDAALAEARKAIYVNGNQLEWGTPVLFMRADDGVLFNLPPTDGYESEERNSAPNSKTPINTKSVTRSEGVPSKLVFRPEPEVDLNKLREQHYESLYDQASIHFDKQEWQQAIAKYTELLAENSSYKDAASKLKQSQQFLEADKLHRVVPNFIHTEKWQDALDLLKRVKELNSKYPKIDEEIAAVQKKIDQILVQQQRKRDEEYQRLVGEYDKANNFLNRGALSKALDLLRKIQKSNFEHSYKVKFLDAVKNKIYTIEGKIAAEQEAENKKSAQDRILQEQEQIFFEANQLAVEGKLDEALILLRKILEVDFEHPWKVVLTAKVKYKILEIERQKIYTAEPVATPEILTEKGYTIKPPIKIDIPPAPTPKPPFVTPRTVGADAPKPPSSEPTFDPYSRGFRAERGSRTRIPVFTPAQEPTVWEKTKKFFREIDWEGLAIIFIILLCGAVFFGFTYLNLSFLRLLLNKMIKDVLELPFWGEFTLLSLAEVVWIVIYSYANDNFISYKQILSGRTVWYKILGLLTSLPFNLIPTYILSHLLAMVEIKIFDVSYPPMFLINFVFLTIIGILSLVWLDGS